MRTLIGVTASVVALFLSACGSGGSPGNAPPIDGGHATGRDSSKPDVAAVISCPSGESPCSGTCTVLASDEDNCGTCGNACGAGVTCCSGVCVTTQSCTFAVTALDPRVGWQSGGTFVKLTGAGFAAGAVVTIGDGVAPAYVIDATTIMIETPPGPVGAQDVTVKLGSMSAKLASGYTYTEATLDSSWQQKGLTTGRYGPAMTVLEDGRALIAGGLSGLPWNTALATADVYTEPQPAATLVSSMMSTPRFIASAVTMLNGKVILAGGACQLSTAQGGCVGNPTAIDLFEAATNTFAPSAASFPSNVVAIWGVLLPDSRVFFVNNTLPSVAIYDPALDSLTSIPLPIPGPYGLDYPFLARLRDGRVLFGSGDLAGTGMPASYTYLFDPTTSTVSATGPFAHLRSGATANTLPDGRVLVVGGADPGDSYNAVDTMELYDPTTGTFTLTPYTLSTVRSGHTSVLVRDGTVLAIAGSVGGIKDCTDPTVYTATVDQIDPVAGTVTPFPALPQPTEGLSGIVMQDGSVLVGGGAQCGVAPTPYVDFLAAPPVNPK